MAPCLRQFGKTAVYLSGISLFAVPFSATSSRTRSHTLDGDYNISDPQLFLCLPTTSPTPQKTYPPFDLLEWGKPQARRA